MAKISETRQTPVSIPAMPRVLIPTLTPLGPTVRQVVDVKRQNMLMRNLDNAAARAEYNAIVDEFTRTRSAEPNVHNVGDNTLAPNFALPSNVKGAGDADDNVSDDIPDGTGDTSSDNSDATFETPGNNREPDTSASSAGHFERDADDEKSARGRNALGRFHNSTDPHAVVGADLYEGQAVTTSPSGDAKETAVRVARVRAQTQDQSLPLAIPDDVTPPTPRTP
jgi:hypothetical protein